MGTQIHENEDSQRGFIQVRLTSLVNGQIAPESTQELPNSGREEDRG
jgi:hypothetical protein